MIVQPSAQFIDCGLDTEAALLGAPPPAGIIAEPEQDIEQYCMGSYADAGFLLPESMWERAAENGAARFAKCVRRNSNQGSEGACVSHGTTNAMLFKAYQTHGKKAKFLSPMSLYARIGRSSSSGAMISDGFKYTSVTHDGYGVLPLAGQGYDDPHTFQERGFREGQRYLKANPGWEVTGKKYRAEWYTVRNDAEYISALLQGDPILVGRKGHSIMYGWVIKNRGSWMACYINSWSGWGDPINDFLGHGLGYDSTRLWGTGYACRSVVSN